MLCLRRLIILLCFLFLTLASTRPSMPPPLFASSCGKIVTPCSCCSGDVGSCGAALPPKVEAGSYVATSPFSSMDGSCVTASCSSNFSWMGAIWGITISVNTSKGFWVAVFFLLGSIATKSFGGGAAEISSS